LAEFVTADRLGTFPTRRRVRLKGRVFLEAVGMADAAEQHFARNGGQDRPRSGEGRLAPPDCSHAEMLEFLRWVRRGHAALVEATMSRARQNDLLQNHHRPFLLALLALCHAELGMVEVGRERVHEADDALRNLPCPLPFVAALLEEARAKL
jgi:hypothetical protein